MNESKASSFSKGLGAQISPPAKPVPASFAASIRGESKSPLELHLQSCVQALLAVYQHQIFDVDQDDKTFKKSERKWVAGLDRPAPAEAPIAVSVQGNQVILRESRAIGEVLFTLTSEEMARQVRPQSDGFKNIYVESLKEELEYRDDVLEEAFDEKFIKRLEEKCKTSVEQVEEGGYRIPKEAFVKALSDLMEESQCFLKDLSEEYGTPCQVDANMLRASGSFRG